MGSIKFRDDSITMAEIKSNGENPRHIAIILDGNGRWAKKRNLPRIAGHRAGFEAVRKTVKACASRNIEVLTLFAFSSENWTRPTQEVGFLMKMFLKALQRELDELNKNKIQLRIIGNYERFDQRLQEWIHRAVDLTHQNTGPKLVIAADYGGKWDILQATRRIAEQVQQNKLTLDAITPTLFSNCLSTADLPNPDLLIRTSGEQRISNFLLWQMAYTELFFTPTLWPDFNEALLDEAIQFYRTRERRYGGLKDLSCAKENVNA